MKNNKNAFLALYICIISRKKTMIASSTYN